MARFQIGEILEPWVDMEPPISTESVKELKPAEKEKEKEKVCEVVAEKEVPSDIAKEPQVATLSEKGKIAHCTTTTTEVYIDLTEKEEIERDLLKYPSLDPETQRGISKKFREMQEKAKEQGLYVCDYTNYALDVCRYALLFGLFFLAFTNGYYMIAAVFLGCFWQQIMFVAHDAGHLGITHDFTLDTILGVLVADLCCGLSLGWWKSSHNVHHLVPNHPVSLDPLNLVYVRFRQLPLTIFSRNTIQISKMCHCYPLLQRFSPLSGQLTTTRSSHGTLLPLSSCNTSIILTTQ